MTRKHAKLGPILILTVVLGHAVPRAWAEAPRAILAGRYVAVDGSLKSDAAIVLAGDKISEIVPEAELPDGDGDGVVRYPNGVLCPGLIDIRSQLGAFGNAVETVHAVDPGPSAIDSLDRHHRDFSAALRAGITTVMIAPSANNLVSGVAATVKTATQGNHHALLREDGPLMFALGPSVWGFDREPTSRVGSLAMLRAVLDPAGGTRSHPRIQAFVAGKLDGMVVCGEAMDVSAAVRTFRGLGSSVAIVHTGDEHDLVEELTGAGFPVVVGPYSFAMTPRTLATAGVYAAGGVPVAFAGHTPMHAFDSLRITAALAVRYGMDASAARRAMSTIPAIIAGVSKRVGSIHPDLDADLVVFSDDPLRLDARVMAVYVGGALVYSAKADDRADSASGPSIQLSSSTVRMQELASGISTASQTTEFTGGG